MCVPGFRIFLFHVLFLGHFLACRSTQVSCSATGQTVVSGKRTICDAQKWDGSIATILAPDEGIGNIFAKHVANFEQQCGGKVIIRAAPYRQPPYFETLRGETKAKSSIYDMYVLQSTWLMENADGLEDITSRVRTDLKLGWEDIFPNTREFVANYDSKAYLIPIDQDMMFVHYRDDVRESLGMQPPETWDDVINFAKAAHNKDWNNDGLPDFGFCVASQPGGEAKWNFMTVFSTIAQVHGTKTGTYFNTDTLEPLWETEAAREAARIWIELSKYGAAEWNPSSQGNYSTARDIFSGCTMTGNLATDCDFFRTVPRTGTMKPASQLTAWPFQWNSMAVGRCALSVDWAALESLMHGDMSGVGVIVRNKMKSALVGSTKVLDRATGRLVQCSSLDVCPYGVVGRGGKIINRATFHASGGWGIGLNKFADQNVKDFAYDFMRYVSINMEVDASSFATWVQPFRNSLNSKDVFKCTGVSDEYINLFLKNHDEGLRDGNAAADFRIQAGTRLAYQLDQSVNLMIKSLSSYTAAEVSDAISTFQREASTRWKEVLAEPQWGSLEKIIRDYKVSLGNKVATQADRNRCKKGEYLSALTLLCASCEAGRFMSNEGKDQSENELCQNCPRGTYADLTGLSQCKNCSQGYYAGENGRTSCLDCTPGKFTSANGMSECVACDRGTFAEGFAVASCTKCSAAVGLSNASKKAIAGSQTKERGSSSQLDCQCPPDTYLHPASHSCLPCPLGMVCNGYGPEALAKEGYMVLQSQPFEVYLCIKKDVCPGGLPDSCAGGAKGIACSECPPEFYPNGQGCDKCTGWETLLVVVVALLAVAVLAIIIRYSFVKPRTQTLQSLVMLMVAGQTLTFIMMLGAFRAFNLGWGEPFRDVLRVFGFLGFDLDTVRVQCTMSSDPAVQYAMKMCAPILCTSVIVGTFQFLRLMKTINVDIDVIVNSVGQLIALFVIPLTLATLTPLQCYPHPNGSRSVFLHPQVLCGESAHGMMLVVAVFGVLLYPVGMMSLVVYAVLTYPRKIMSDDIGFIRRFRFMFFRWSPHCYWFTVVYMLRNLLTPLFPMVVPTENVEVAVVCVQITLLGSFALMVKFQPWCTSGTNALDSSLSFLLIFILIIGSLSLNGAAISGASSMMLTVLCLICILACLCWVLADFVSKMRQADTFALFLSHYKAASACAARFLKLVLARRVKGHIFFDSDNLNSFGGIFDAVKMTKHFLIILDTETLCRPWVVGEIVTAHACNIYTTCCTMGNTQSAAGFVHRWAQLQGDALVAMYGKFEALRPHGISLEEIAPALAWLMEKGAVHINMADEASMNRAIEDCLRQPDKAVSDASSSKADSGSNALTTAGFSDILIMSDSSDSEATASARVLKVMLQEMLQKQATLDVNLSTSDLHSLFQADASDAILWIVTPSTLKSSSQLARLALLYQIRPEAEANPVLIGESFAFPSEEFYLEFVSDCGPFGSLAEAERVLSQAAGAVVSPKDAVDALRRVFQSIANFVNIPYANEEMLTTSVKTLADRVINSSTRKESKLRAAPAPLPPSFLQAASLSAEAATAQESKAEDLDEVDWVER